MKTNVLFISFLSFICVLLNASSCMAYGPSGTGFGTNNMCYVNTHGSDEYWFCGSQAETCKENPPTGGNKRHWLYHGDQFTDEYSDGKHFCCGGTQEKAGRFVKGNKWLIKTETVAETVYDVNGNPIGKCSWNRQINICGEVDNPNDKCTEATEECRQGYVSHNKRCVKACATGYAFAGEYDDNCVKIDKSDPQQGSKEGYVIQCNPNQFWDAAILTCVDQKDKTAISTAAFTVCWKCDNPNNLKKCLLEYTKDNIITTPDIKDACKIK
ncbi:MAG: hypothetical protein KBS86_02235 [Proteobacteria bacterium]|nr:hypothetical protein [Candidatus Enterousia scatequi]